MFCCEVLLVVVVWFWFVVGMLVDWLLDRLMFFLLEVVCWLEDDGDFSVELIFMINSSSIRIFIFIMMYWWEVGLVGVFLCLCG